MPAASTTARTEPPAMTPVPWLAGFRRTLLAEKTVRTSCGIVVPTIGILMRFFLASSTPLRIASGTSPALPSPTPTWPRAVTDDDDRAEAEPPAALDDLGDAVDLDDALLERELVGVDSCHVGSSEIQAGFAGRVGERLDCVRGTGTRPGRTRPGRRRLLAPARRRCGPTADASADFVPLADREVGLEATRPRRASARTSRR